MSKQSCKRVRKTLGLPVNREPLPSFAWPGGYPMYYLDGHNSVLCAKCATSGCIAENEHTFPRYLPVAFGIHYEGDSLFCDDCNVEIESAYGPTDDDN